jgi:hypothetical protein
MALPTLRDAVKHPVAEKRRNDQRSITAIVEAVSPPTRETCGIKGQMILERRWRAEIDPADLILQ